jgi:glutathione S-transferase
MNREVEDRILGPWLLGDRYSIADAYALPFYRWGNRIGIPMAECCPRWAAWAERMLQRPAVREAIDTEKLGYESFDVKNSD